MKQYVIVSVDEHDDEGQALYWNNQDGWVRLRVRLSQAEVWDDTEDNLPLGGRWADLADEKVKLGAAMLDEAYPEWPKLFPVDVSSISNCLLIQVAEKLDVELVRRWSDARDHFFDGADPEADAGLHGFDMAYYDGLDFEELQRAWDAAARARGAVF